MIERGHQLDLAREQHAVAEHVAGHVADSSHRERLALNVAAELAKVALDALPGAARGDRHLLVVIAGGTAGGKGIAQPEAVFGRDGVGDVGEGRRALVGRDYQVGIIAIQARTSAAPRRGRRRCCR
jgi:hypothetical protein